MHGFEKDVNSSLLSYSPVCLSLLPSLYFSLLYHLLCKVIRSSRPKIDADSFTMQVLLMRLATD